jgi:hypothetical protein
MSVRLVRGGADRVGAQDTADEPIFRERQVLGDVSVQGVQDSCSPRGHVYPLLGLLPHLTEDGGISPASFQPLVDLSDIAPLRSDHVVEGGDPGLDFIDAVAVPPYAEGDDPLVIFREGVAGHVGTREGEDLVAVFAAAEEETDGALDVRLLLERDREAER